MDFNLNCRRFRDKKEAAEPEADPERDQRTVFAYQVDCLALLFVINIIRSDMLGIWYPFLMIANFLSDGYRCP